MTSDLPADEEPAGHEVLTLSSCSFTRPKHTERTRTRGPVTQSGPEPEPHSYYHECRHRVHILIRAAVFCCLVYTVCMKMRPTSSDVSLFYITSQLLQLFSRTLQLCLTVKLQNCSVDYDTSPAPSDLSVLRSRDLRPGQLHCDQFSSNGSVASSSSSSSSSVSQYNQQQQVGESSD